MKNDFEELSMADVGHVFNIKIDGRGTNGDYFGRVKRKIVFLKDCKESLAVNQVVPVKITFVVNKNGFGKLLGSEDIEK